MNDNLSSIAETAVDENVNIHPNKRSESKDAVAASKGLSPIASSAKDVSEVDSEKEISPHRINIKDRFTFAKKQQEKREKERLNKIKHNPRHSMQPSDLAALDASSENSMYQSPTQKDFTNKFRQGLATPNMLWSDAIRKLQEKQEHRHKQVRTASQDASKQVDAFQVASKRINQWEEIVFYEPTALELANTWQKVRGYLQMPVEDQTAYIQNVEECQAMIIGSVKVMSCEDFSTETMAYLQSQLTPRTKYMGLKTSIHAIGTNATITIPLKMIAIVCRVHPHDHDLALFVVAHVQPGYSEDDVATIFYTPLQLKLFAPSSTSTTTTGGGAKGILAQKTVQIMSSESQAAFQDVLIEDFPISDFYEDEYAQPGQVSSSTMDEIQRAIQANGGELCSPEVRAMTRKLSMGVRADYQEYATPVHNTKRSASGSGSDDDEAAARAFNSNFSSPFHAVEGELPTSVSPMIEYSASTPKKAWGTPVPPAKDDSATTMSLSGDASVMTSSLAAASTLSVPSQAFINLDLQLVESIACTEKTLLLQKHTAAAAADETERSVVMINHALKTTVCENAQCVTLDNRLFELNRGVAISGSIAKLPTSAQGWGQAKRRFFVLKDTSLAYFFHKPAGDVFAPELRPKRLYPITEHTQIDVIHIAGVRRCVKITFPETQQTLYWYFHHKTPSNQAKEAKWIHGIRQAIALQRTKQEAMLTTMSLKTWWFHEGNDFQLIAYDVARVVSSLEDEWAMNGPGEYVRVALFRTQTSYFCDMILPSQEKLQVALVRTNEQPVLCCSTATKSGTHDDGTAVENATGTAVTLRTVKIYGDKLLFGGDGNVLFVGMLGRTTGVHLTEAGRKVLYCVPVAWPSPTSTTTGRRPSVSKSTTATAAAAAATATRSAASAAAVRRSRRSQFDSDASDADDTDDDDDNGNGQWDVDMSFEEDPVDAAAARSRGPAAYSRQPRRLRPRGGGGSRSRTTSQASATSIAPSTPPSLPSMTSSYRWDSFATDDRMHVFVAIDRRQNVLATFQCDLPTATTPPTSRLLESPSKKRPGFYYQVKPELQSMFSLAQLATTAASSTATNDERILHAQFLADYPAGHLLVSTTHRLLLLCITAQEKSMWNSTTLGGGGGASTTSPMSASSVVTATQPMVFAVSSYVVLDTVDVAAGQRGAFAVQSVSAPSSSVASSSMRRVSSSRVSLSSAASSHSETVIGGASSSSSPSAQQKLVLWRVVQEAAATADTTAAESSIRLAHVTRREISREQVQELLCRAHGV